MADLFDDTKDTPNAPDHVITADDLAEGALDKLVGEGKKFKDHESLAKAKLESDNFIRRLQEENAGLRQDLASRTTLEEFMETMKSQTSEGNASASNQETPSSGDRDDPEISVDAIVKQVRDSFVQEQTEAKQLQNVQLVEDKAREAYGPNYKEKLRERAEHLGTSTQRMSQLAKDDPNAFIAVMIPEGTTPPSVPTVPPASSVNTEGQAAVGGNEQYSRKSHFDKLRTENPDVYWSPAIQNKMHAMAQKYGAEFFDS